MKRVTVVIAARNEEMNLVACLDAVLANTYPNFDVIVVDDASEDRTPDILREYKNPKLRVIREDKPQGPAQCRNLGWRISNADIIFFTDADCSVAPTWIEAGLRCLSAPGVVGVEGSIQSQRFSSRLSFRTPINPFYVETEQWTNLPQRDFAASNIAYHRWALEKAEGFNQKRYPHGREDSDLGWRAQAWGRIAYCPTMQVTHAAEWWTKSMLRQNVQRYQADVTFLKDHRFFFFRRGPVLHPRLLKMLIFPPSIFWYWRVGWKDLHFMPAFFFYLLALRVSIWRSAWRERVLAI